MDDKLRMAFRRVQAVTDDIVKSYYSGKGAITFAFCISERDEDGSIIFKRSGTGKGKKEMDKRNKIDGMYESSYRKDAERRSPEMNRDQEEKDRNGPWRGFLILQCAECGKVRAFNTKRDIYVYKCGCGAETILENLKPMYLDCKCGANWRYKTNLEDEYTDHKCIRCGSMVRMRLNKRRTAYVTER